MAASKTHSSLRKLDPNQSATYKVLNAKEVLRRYGYELGQEIGSGSYSKVKICLKRLKNPEGNQTDSIVMACKIINLNRVSENFETKFLPRELNMAKKICHANIIQVRDIVQYDRHVYLFMDYSDYGDLMDYIFKKGVVMEPRAQFIFRQVLSAVKYLHKNSIAHRDLKCENVLLSTSGQVRLSDFGYARYCKDERGKKILSETFCGSMSYTAPEVLERSKYNPKASDVWSLGCILFIMLTGHRPFDNSSLKSMIEAQKAQLFDYSHCLNGIFLSKHATSYIKKLLEPDISRRYTVYQAKKNKWLLSAKAKGNVGGFGNP